jgi:hypothetical protein
MCQKIGGQRRKNLMESVIRPVLTVEYEIARKMISELLSKGLISSEEFNEIDKKNIKTFVKCDAQTITC